MFEKEAEDNKPLYACCSFNTNCELWKDGFQKGAEFGYKKANEWHDLEKDPTDLPKEEKQYLCCVLSCVGGYKVYACLIYDTQYHSWKESYGDVIKWKEIE